ncbi:MAG: adenylate cyclase regulatory domain-containing protein [Acidimicrobiales bacterium]
MDLEALRSNGLYDPEAANAGERLALIEHLVALGATIPQMVAAQRAGLLESLGGDLMFFDLGTPLTVQQVAEQCQVTADRVLRVRIASGIPADENSLLPDWMPEVVVAFELAAAMFGEPALLAFTRVMGASSARIGEAAVGLFLSEIESQFAQPGVTELDRARAIEEANGLFDVIAQTMTRLMREHLILAVRRQRTMENAGIGPVAVGICVGFVDLVGSTEWAASISLREQAAAIARFESAAWDIATSRRGRIVKLIGDEAMFVALDPVDACRIASDLCAAAGAEPSLPSARGAVGVGDVVLRDGDYYGPLVHLVARLVKAADTGEVVVTAELRERCERVDAGAFGFESLGVQALRGIEEPVELSKLRTPR